MDRARSEAAVVARIVARIADELSARPAQVTAAVELIDGGATVPFIARYRKEATGGLDDTQLRTLEQRLGYLRELEERRTAIRDGIAGQGKLTDALAAQIDAADTRQRLEDLYLPYRPKRRTRAQLARESGLEPLADALLADPALDPQAEAARFLRAPDAEGEHGVADAKAALDGARDILAELEKPGRDPRGEFVTAAFREGVERIADLKPGMTLQGVVTNVANFGAFVDVGVHQDGLVHVSELADRFVKDPRDVVRAGQVVTVTVLDADVARKRIALSMKRGARAQQGGADAPAAGAQARNAGRGKHGAQRPGKADAAPTALGDALARALGR